MTSFATPAVWMEDHASLNEELVNMLWSKTTLRSRWAHGVGKRSPYSFLLCSKDHLPHFFCHLFLRWWEKGSTSRFPPATSPSSWVVLWCFRRVGAESHLFRNTTFLCFAGDPRVHDITQNNGQYQFLVCVMSARVPRLQTHQRLVRSFGQTHQFLVCSGRGRSAAPNTPTPAA